MALKGKECLSCKKWRTFSMFRPFGIIGRKRRNVCKICEYRLMKTLGALPPREEFIDIALTPVIAVFK